MLCSFSLQLIFFSEQPFYGNYPTLDSHTNNVISHVFAREDGVENRDKVYYADPLYASEHANMDIPTSAYLSVM